MSERNALCLTLKLGESVSVGENMLIVVRRIKGSNVRLAFLAPKDVDIKRHKTLIETLEFPNGSKFSFWKDIE